MPSRRGHERFDLEVPLPATVLVVGDVVLCPRQEGGIETMEMQMQVIAQTPPLPDDLMTLHLVDDADDSGRLVRVVDSRPVIVAGQLRHEVQLQETTPAGDGGPKKAPEPE